MQYNAYIKDFFSGQVEEISSFCDAFCIITFGNPHFSGQKLPLCSLNKRKFSHKLVISLNTMKSFTIITGHAAIFYFITQIHTHSPQIKKLQSNLLFMNLNFASNILAL